jgi:hypothetical protein
MSLPNSSGKRSKIQIIGIKLLQPINNKNLYLRFQMNNCEFIKTKILDFGNENKCILNQTFELLLNVNKFKLIDFEIYDEKNPNKFLYKGVILDEKNLQKTTHGKSYLCGLKNNNGENCAIVYFDFEFNNSEININENKESLSKNNDNDINNLNPNDGLNNNIFDIPVCNLFIQNLNYLRNILFFFEGIMRWKNKWQTLSYLFMFTLIVLNFQFFFVFILPLVFIFCHLMYKDKINTFLIHKNPKSNNKKDYDFLYIILNYYNIFFDLYESYVNKMISGDKIFIYEFYKSIILMVFFNFIFFYLGLINYINLNLLFILSVWLIVLSFNPSFYSFEIFIISLINTKITPIFNSKQSKELKSNLNTLFSFFIPFYYNITEILKKDEKEKVNSIYVNDNKILNNSLSSTIVMDDTQKLINRNPSKRNSISYFSDNNKIFQNSLIEKNQKISLLDKKISTDNLKNDNQNIFKYEILENERWWMLVGWKKSLIRNEIPLWCKVNDQKNFCDLNMVFLPNNNKDKYKWLGEWKIEKTINTDENGWEYSSDFHSKFTNKKEGNYVRRRKWVRFACKI